MSMNTLEVLDASGHVTLSWTADDEASLTRARDEFDRLKAAGYAFFSTPEEDAEEIMGWPKRGKPPAWTKSGSLDVRSDDELGSRAFDAEVAAARVGKDASAEPPVERVTEFPKGRKRTTAVRPMAGG